MLVYLPHDPHIGIAQRITDEAERAAYLADRADKDDVRIVVGVLRGGETWCALRTRSHDSPDAVAQGPRLVPGLSTALAATLV